MEFRLEEQAITILTLEAVFICICFCYAAWKVYRVFHKIGFGAVGNSVTWGFVLLACSYVIQAIPSFLLYSASVEDLITTSILGRLIQVVSALLLVIGFGRYYDWASGRFSKNPGRFARRRTDSKPRTIEIEDRERAG